MALGPNCAAGASRPTNWSLSLAALEGGPAYNPPAWPRPSTPVTVLQLSDLHLQLSEKYMIYKDYAERAMINP